MALFWVALAGFAGAVARFWVGSRISRRSGAAFPWATLVINLTGSAMLGLVVGLDHSPFALPGPWRVAVGAGFLGAYTTFSTLCLESVRLAQGQDLWRAGANLAGSVILGLAAAWAGIALGARL